jgi:hypothetical protein
MTDLRSAAREAWLYTLPLIEIATVRSRGQSVGSAMNTFSSMRNLADHRQRTVTTPNNDTFYATAQLDLANGPVTLTVPPSGERYVSLQLMDAWSNSFAILGTRTTGNGGGVYTLVGPEEAASGRNVVRSPSRHVWALARILVDGPHDLDAARLLQSGFSAQGPDAPPATQYARRQDDWAAYFASVDALMAANPPPVTDGAVLARIAPLGLGEGRFDPARFSPDEAAEIEAGIAEARRAVRGGGGLSGTRFVDGWAYPAAKLGDFGQDYGLRAAVALGGLAALPLVEATYLQSEGEGRGRFEGEGPWTLTVPADIPLNGFWSLSMYEVTPEGQYFFTDNPLNRYAIGDRTPGLTRDADGGVTILVARHDPGTERHGNWLPAPTSGPFGLFFRAYLPKAELLNGGWRMPAVVVA